MSTQVAGCSAVIRTVVERSVTLRDDVGRVPAGSEECVELNWKRVQLMFVINSMLSLIVSTTVPSCLLNIMPSPLSTEKCHQGFQTTTTKKLQLFDSPRPGLFNYCALQNREEKAAHAANPAQRPTLTVKDIASKVAAAFKDLVTGSLSHAMQLDKVGRVTCHVSLLSMLWHVNYRMWPSWYVCTGWVCQ
jgi:hypothetical protein